MDYQTLKARHRQERHGHHINLTLRVHRALSWLQRAEHADDIDGRFIFLWIAFNAAYATDIDDKYRLSEQEAFRVFLRKLCNLDLEHRIEKLVWAEFPGAIRVLLDNPYVFQSFWDHQKGKLTATEWEKRFTDGRRHTHEALGRRDTAEVLAVMFNRIYTLRNQVMHGGATWNGNINRDQLRDCTNLLGKLAPLIIVLMLDNPDTLWGDASYPVVQ